MRLQSSAIHPKPIPNANFFLTRPDQATKPCLIHKSKPQCTGDVIHCEHATRLVTTMKTYSAQKDDIQFNHELYTNIIDTLDDFNHLLHHHDDNDEDFDYIHSLFETECAAKDCQIIRYHRRNHLQSTTFLDSSTNPNNVKTWKCKECDLVNSMFDTQCIACFEVNTLDHQRDIDEYHNMNNVRYWMNCIHRHYLHSYDMGFRLRQNERRELDGHRDDDDDDQDYYVRQNLLERCGVLAKKRQSFHQALHEDANEIYSSGHNKFSSDLGKTKENYSYGFKLFYWDYHRKLEDEHDDIYYVPPKYKNLKEELTENVIQKMSLKQFIGDCKKVEKYRDTEFCATIKADVDEYCKRELALHVHPSHYGLHDSSPLSVEHLVSVLIYCGYDILQEKFSGTLRKNKPDENMQDLVKRNSNYHHFSKYLHEAVNVFGRKQMDGTTRQFYHGINKTLLFEETHANIHGILSTTSSFNVAANFAHSGVVLELSASNSLKYFSCPWLSPYSNEQEKLFIGGFLSFTFVNIFNAKFKRSYFEFIKAMAIIDTMTNGKFFNDDPSIIGKLLKVDHWNPRLVDAKELKPRYQKILIALIKHELGIKKWNKLDSYAENLFHRVCVSKKEIIINWRALQLSISDRWEVGDGGHVGYEFLKQFFCQNGSDIIDLEFIRKLYPNVSKVELFAFNKIDPSTIEYVFNSLSVNKKTSINCVGFYLLKKSTNLESIQQSIDLFTSKFKKISFRINHSNHSVFKWNGLEIHKS